MFSQEDIKTYEGNTKDMDIPDHVYRLKSSICHGTRSDLPPVVIRWNYMPRGNDQHELRRGQIQRYIERYPNHWPMQVIQ